MKANVTTMVALVLVAAACTEQKKPVKGAASTVPGTTLAATAPDTTTPKRANPRGAMMGTKAQQIDVTNATATPMDVVALVGNRTDSLGTLAPNQRASFSVQAEPGGTIHMAASDRTKTHQVPMPLVAADTVLHWIIR